MMGFSLIGLKYIIPKPITCGGETKSQGRWAKETGGRKNIVRERIKNGWLKCKAATMPVNEKLSAAQKLVGRKRALLRVVRKHGVFVPRA